MLCLVFKECLIRAGTKDLSALKFNMLTPNEDYGCENGKSETQKEWLVL